MKKIIVLFFIFTAPYTFAEEITIKVNGMVCSMCAQGIQKKFSKLSEVKNLSVDLDTKIVSVTTKDGQSVNDTTIKEIISEAGYNVQSIERK